LLLILPKEIAMNHYHRQLLLLLSAPPATVYQALTTPQGLRDWWTQTCDVATTVGSKTTFLFCQTWKVMRIESLVPEREVRWHCVEAHIEAPGITRDDEWVGTDIVFRLAPQDGGKTLLDFEHLGLLPSLQCFKICENGWDLFLGSLQSLVESGQGAPFTGASACHSLPETV
jgi:uncharacterized protein YndB with AHSA1/START domain